MVVGENWAPYRKLMGRLGQHVAKSPRDTNNLMKNYSDNLKNSLAIIRMDILITLNKNMSIQVRLCNSPS